MNFMGNPNTMMRPLHIGNQMVERISSYNLLAVIINENWKWNCHVDYITSKASKKLYALRLLKRAVACKNNKNKSLEVVLDRF